MKKNHTFYIAIGILFVSLLSFNSYFFKGSEKYLGITTAKEYKISSEKSATVKKVHVIPGQAVKRGQLLVELISKNLEIDISKLRNRVEVLNSEIEEKKKEVLSEIDYLKAQKGIKVEEIDAEMLQIKKELELNFKLIDQVGGSANKELNDDDPLSLEISSLEEKKRLHKKAIDIKIKEIQQKNISAQQVIVNRVRLFEKELEMLINEKQQLSKYATFDGVVENVYVKENEEIQAYSSILSVNPKSPTSVVGYVVGKKTKPKKVGEKVQVASYDKRTDVVEGTIIGLGAITALPDILQKSTSIKAYGLEVFINIGEHNKLSTGQKVVVN